MKRKSIVLMLVLTLIMPSFVFAADGGKPNHPTEQEHWGMSILKTWEQQGLISGFPDGSLRPDEQVTRAQFVKLLNTIFDFSAVAGIHEESSSNRSSATFSDVAAGDWFFEDVTAVATAGIIQGYPDGSFKPAATVSRQDAAKMLVAAYKLKDNAMALDQKSQYSDYSAVAGYAKEAVEQLLTEGAIQGYPDGTIRPLKALSRAEAVTLLNRLSGTIIHEAGTYSDLELDGNLVLGASGIVLKNVTVKGSIYVTPGVAEGNVSLSGVKAGGILHVNGGGVNSIYIEDSEFGHIIVNKSGGKVRVVLSKQTRIQQLDVEQDAIIELDEESSVELLSLLQGASGSELKGKGTIKKLLNAAGINLPEHYKNLEGGSAGQGNEPSVPGTPQQPNPQPTNPPEDEWQLVWNDEFDQSGTNLDVNGLDLDKWGYQLGTGSQYGLDGWGNNEQQYYRSENIIVEDGLLKITAKAGEHEGKPFTSGRLYTDSKFSKTYGKFEARMKLPTGDGLWPAFWMMPEGSAYGTWAASGEIDIMEARGRLPQEIGGAIHYGKTWPNNKSAAKEYHFPEGEDITGFHVYGLEWEPGELRWYVDGVLYQTINNWDSWGDNQPAKYAFPAPFDKPFHMIMNLAVGGNYDGGRMPDASMEAAEMLVDYVRVYDLVGRPYREIEEPSVEVEPIEGEYKEAVDGSYVYDAGFEQPITTITTGDQAFNADYWNFVYLDTFGGAGNITVDTIDDDRLAKVSISQAGSQAHSIQLIQHATIGKGRWYKLSFDAKSEANRNMTVKIGGGESRGWSVYSDSYEIAMTPELQSYERVFQMTADTDKQARLEFNMGLNSSTIWIGDVRLEEVDAPDPYNEEDNKEPLADGNHIYNGSFDLGYIHRLTYWQLDAADGAEAKLTVDAQQRELRAEIIDGGEQAGDIKLLQHGTSLIGGNDYELTFKARGAGSIGAVLLRPDGTAYANPQSIQLTEEMNEYKLSFSLPNGVAGYGKFAFLLGEVEDELYLDDIVLIRTTNNNVGKLSLSQQFPLKNGDFSNNLESWTPHVQGFHDGWDLITNAAVVDGELVFNIEGPGGDRWHVMLMQNGLQLAKNQTYVVTVDAKSSVARDMEIILETAQYESYVAERVALTEDWQTFSYELPMTEEATLDFKLMLGALAGATPLGKHTVTIDNVRIEVKDARGKAFLVSNGSFDEGMDGWLSHVQGVYGDNPSAAGFAVTDGALHATINHWGINPWDIVLFQDAVPVTKGETYVVSFVAKGDAARVIEVIAENGTYMRSLNQPVQLTADAQLYSYEFTMERDENVQLKFLLGKPANATSEAATHHIYIDNVQFELKGARAATGELARAEHDLN